MKKNTDFKLNEKVKIVDDTSNHRLEVGSIHEIDVIHMNRTSVQLKTKEEHYSPIILIQDISSL